MGTTIVSLPSFDVTSTIVNFIDTSNKDEEFNFSKRRGRATTLPATNKDQLLIINLMEERRKVRFSSDSPLVDIIPADEIARTSRVGPWGIAPFHDEIWDGETGQFREIPLSQDELRQENLRHAILTKLSQVVEDVKFVFGMSDKRIRKEKEETERSNTDLDRFLGGIYQTLLKLVGPSA